MLAAAAVAAAPVRSGRRRRIEYPSFTCLSVRAGRAGRTPSRSLSASRTRKAVTSHRYSDAPALGILGPAGSGLARTTGRRLSVSSQPLPESPAAIPAATLEKTYKFLQMSHSTAILIFLVLFVPFRVESLCGAYTMNFSMNDLVPHLIKGGSTEAEVSLLTDFRGLGPAVSKKQDSNRYRVYERERDFLMRAQRLGLDKSFVPALYDNSDDTRTIFMSFVDDQDSPPLQTPMIKDRIMADLLQLAITHKAFHNDIKWDNIKYDRVRNRPVLLDFDWSTFDKSGHPYFGQMHLPIRVGTHHGVTQLCALSEAASDEYSVWLYTLDKQGSLLEHQRLPTGWTSRNLTSQFKLAKMRTCACTIHEARRILFTADCKGNLHELSFSAHDVSSRVISGRVELKNDTTGGGDSRARSLRPSDCVIHRLSEVVCVLLPADGPSCEKLCLVFFDKQGGLCILWREGGGEWNADVIKLPIPPILEPGTRVVAGPVVNQVSILYCSARSESDSALCEVLWQGPAQWFCRIVPDAPSRIRRRSLAAVFGDVRRAYFSTADGKVWELKEDKEAWRMPIKSVPDGPLLALPLPRSRAEGGGFAGREVVAVRKADNGDGMCLRRMFLGGGILEGAGEREWRGQQLTDPRPYLQSLPLGGERAEDAVLCGLATAAGAHHVFYAAKDGVIVEL